MNTNQHIQTNENFDVVIAGGSLSGCLTALSLAPLTNLNGKPLRIAIIEAKPQQPSVIAENKKSPSSFDERVLALSHHSAQYFKQLGLWQHLSAFANPIETIHISDRGHYGKARLYAQHYQVEALGYVAEMQRIGQALLAALAGFSNITWFCPQQIESIEWQRAQVNVQLSNQQVISAALLLACDGAHSTCRQQAGIENSLKPYQQSALIANISMSKKHQNIAFERFTEHGPIAMLPLTENRCSLVWTLPPDEAERLQQLPEHDFNQALTQAFGLWLGQVNTLGSRTVYPLNLVQAQQNTYHRMALIGNASHTIHPIAGQGFNLGVRDVAKLAALVKSALLQGDDIGNLLMLNQYANDRLDDQNHIITLTDALVTLFSNKLPPLVIGRNLALKALNYGGDFKRRFVNKTMGY